MKKVLIIFCCFLLMIVTGCSSKNADNTKVNEEKVVLRYTETLQQYGFKEPVVLEQIPQRVVSLVNTPVLALYEMGINQVVIPQSKVVKYPDKLLEKSKQINVAINKNIDMETVIGAKPDLVILGYYAKDTYGKILESQKIPVYYVDAGPTVSYKSIKDLTYIFIEAFGQNNQGANGIKQRFEDLEERIAAEKQKNAGKKVMILQSFPQQNFIQTKNATVGTMLDMLGYENVYHNEINNMVMLDKEQALSYDPDVLICVSTMEDSDEYKNVMQNEFSKNSAYWNGIKAVHDNHVIFLSNEYMVSGGINIIDNINKLIDMLHKQNL